MQVTLKFIHKKTLGNMKDRNKLPYLRDVNRSDEEPLRDFSTKVNQKVGSTWLQFAAATSGNLI